AEAILNMRLRSLRKLEEMEIRGEHKELIAEQTALNALPKSEQAQWAKVGEEIREVKAKYGPKTELGRRRTTFADAPAIEFVPPEAMIEREPVTIVCSAKGWIRSMKGHLAPDAEIK